MTAVRVVLLVESDPPCARALARLLRRRGHRVRVAGSARAALHAAGRESFDLAVVDLLLPGGGVEVARRLSKRVPRLYLSVGARLLPGEIVEMALGFPVLRKAKVPGLVSSRRGRGAAPAPGSGPREPKAPKRPGGRRPRAATGRAS